MLSLALLFAAGGALAQTDAPADPRSVDSAERAKRENEKIYKWIKLQIATPKRPPETKPAPAATKSAPVARKSPAATTAAAPEPEDGRAVPVTTTPEAAPAVANPSPDATTAVASPNPIAATAAPEPLVSPPAGAAALPPAPDDDPPLVLVNQVEPDYPPALRRHLQKGWVQVRFEVLPDGSVKQPEIESSSHVKLNAAALQAVAQWKFQPVRRTQYAIVELRFETE